MEMDIYLQSKGEKNMGYPKLVPEKTSGVCSSFIYAEQSILRATPTMSCGPSLTYEIASKTSFRTTSWSTTISLTRSMIILRQSAGAYFSKNFQIRKGFQPHIDKVEISTSSS